MIEDVDSTLNLRLFSTFVGKCLDAAMEKTLLPKSGDSKSWSGMPRISDIGMLLVRKRFEDDSSECLVEISCSYGHLRKARTVISAIITIPETLILFLIYVQQVGGAVSTYINLCSIIHILYLLKVRENIKSPFSLLSENSIVKRGVADTGYEQVLAAFSLSSFKIEWFEARLGNGQVSVFVVTQIYLSGE